jgi:hypothetical protein
LGVDFELLRVLALEIFDGLVVWRGVVVLLDPLEVFSQIPVVGDLLIHAELRQNLSVV